MHILHICGHKRSISSPSIFRPTIYGALSSRAVSHCVSDRNTYTIENIGLIILKRPLRPLWKRVDSADCPGAETVLCGGLRGQRSRLVRRLEESCRHVCAT